MCSLAVTKHFKSVICVLISSVIVCLLNFFLLLSVRGRLRAVSRGGEVSRKLDEALCGWKHVGGSEQHGQEGSEAVSGGAEGHEFSSEQTAGQIRHVLHDRGHDLHAAGEKTHISVREK